MYRQPLSGRKESAREYTKEWLKYNNILYDKLLMRKDNDDRKDAIVKKEIYDNIIKDNYNVLFVLDDRDSVVKMWRDEGLDCFQVYYGNF